MRIAIEFDSLEEALPFLQATYPASAGPVSLTPSYPEQPPTGSTTPAVETEKPKRARRTKAELAADLAAAQAAPQAKPAIEPQTAQGREFDDAPPGGDFLDDDAPTPAPVVTKDDVRNALVAYQERLTKSGKDVEAARTTVLALLKKVSGADKLGACPDDKFAAVIEAAKTAK